MCIYSIAIPYSRLFSLGANFPEFPEWARDWKIYAGLLIRFNCGFNVAIAIMVLYVGTSIDKWNASIALRLFI